MRALIMLILLILSNISQARGICHSTYERLYLKTHPKLKGTSARIRLQKRPVVHFPLNRDNSPASGGAILFTRRTHSMSLHSLRPTVFAAAAILCLASAASPLRPNPVWKRPSPRFSLLPSAMSGCSMVPSAMPCFSISNIFSVSTRTVCCTCSGSTPAFPQAPNPTAAGKRRVAKSAATAWAIIFRPAP